jgi:uncharacterized membrane protein YcaP (DUF421 family)
VLHDLFHLDIPVVEKVVRTVGVYLVVFMLLRFFGKRALAQFTAFDLIVLLLLSNVVQNAIIGPDNSLLGGSIGAFVLLVSNYLIVRYAFTHPRVGRALRGRETRLVEDGRVDSDSLMRELVTEPELDTALRRQGYDGIDGVVSARLEPEGVLVADRREDPTLARIEQRLAAIESKLG